MARAAETALERRPRGRPRALTRDQVVDAALVMLSRDGAAAVSIRGLATELGVTPPTVYAYVTSKDDLLMAMLDRFFDAAPIADSASDDWVGELRRTNTTYYDLYLNNPNMLRLLTTTAVRSERTQRLVEANLALLLNAGFSERESYLINRSLSHHLIGCAVIEIGRRELDAAGAEAVTAQPPQTGPLMQLYITHMTSLPSSEVFSFGLELLLRSIQDRRPANGGTS